MAVRLPADLLARLRNVLTPAECLVVATDWAELSGVLRRDTVDLIVIDPAWQRPGGPPHEAGSAAALSVLAEFPGIPVVAYTAYTRESMRALLPLAHSGVQQVVLRGFDDTRERLRDLLDQAGARILGERLLAVMVPMLREASAPEELVDAITRLFHSPQSFRTVSQLAAAAGRQRGMLDRWLRRAGLASAKVLIVGARVAWAHHYARSSGYRYKVLALRLGYPTTLPLSRHIKWMTGQTPTELRNELTPDELMPVLLRRIVLERTPTADTPSGRCSS